MTLEELALLLPAQSGISLPGEFARYRQETGAGEADGIDGFIQRLHERNLITPELFRDIHARDDVAIQGLTSFSRMADLVAGAAKLAQEEEDEEEATTVVPALQEKHQLLGIVGAGGMATVHVARESMLGRKVAYKQLLPSMRKDRRLASRFFSEAQITAQLDHPNIVPVYSLDLEQGDAPAYTMKLIEGRTFREVVDETRALVRDGQELPDRLSLKSRLRAFLSVCDALAYAHDKGVIHRDLKPDNIMVGRYHQVYVMDWGLARLIGGEEPSVAPDEGGVNVVAQDGGQSRKTRVGAVLGTPAYMPPEQALGLHHELDGRTDQYALGLVLQEVVTLQQAMPGGGATGMVANAAQGKRLPVEHVAGEPVDVELVAIIDRATRRAQADRYPTVAAMAEDIRRHLNDEPISVLPDSMSRRIRRWIGRHRGKTLIMLLGVLLLAALTLSWSFWKQARDVQRAGRVERQLTDFTAAVAMQGHLIDNRFLELQSRLESLSASAIHLLQTAKPPKTPIYVDTGAGSATPPDAVRAKAYASDLSMGHVVLKVADGVEPESVTPLIKRLAPLAGPFRRMLAESIDPKAQRWSVAKQERYIRDRGSPATWAYVGLAEGVHAGYPGQLGYPADFDPRNRPWYRLSADEFGVQVGNPYIDVKGQGLLLPLSVSLYDSGGRFRGVAGVDLKFDFIIAKFLDMPGQPGVMSTYLIDDRGRVVVGSRDLARRVKAGLHDDEALRLDPYDHAPAVERMVRGASGHARFARDDKEVLIVWLRLPGLNWFYLAEADYLAVVGGDRGGG